MLFKTCSFIVLLGISSTYGFMSMPTEMGMAILAGALGLAFSNIEKISKFKGAGFEAEMKMVHTIIENQTEPSQEQQDEAKSKEDITDIENCVLKRLQKPGYTWRYARTVAGEISLTIAETEKILCSLMSRGYTKNGKGTNGEIWSTTALGKSVQEQYELKTAKQEI